MQRGVASQFAHMGIRHQQSCPRGRISSTVKQLTHPCDNHWLNHRKKGRTFHRRHDKYKSFWWNNNMSVTWIISAIYSSRFRLDLPQFNFRHQFEKWSQNYSVWFRKAPATRCNTVRRTRPNIVIRTLLTMLDTQITLFENVWSKSKHSSNKKCWTNVIKHACYTF